MSRQNIKTPNQITFNDSGIIDKVGIGTPEGAVTAPIGSLYRDSTTGNVYKKDTGTGNTGWVLFGAGGGGAVSSVFGRTGTVTAQSGDYDASEITNTPAGNIVSTTVQDAINELDSQKQGLDLRILTIANQAVNYEIPTSDIDAYDIFLANQTTAGITFTFGTPTGNANRQIIIVANSTANINILNAFTTLESLKIMIAIYNGSTWRVDHVSKFITANATDQVTNPAVQIKYESNSTSSDIQLYSTTGGFAMGRGGGSQVTNTRMGVNTLSANTTGTNNVAIGYNVARLGTTNSDNTLIGYNVAQGAAFSAARSTIIGSQAGTNNPGSDNTFVGALSGNTANATASGNVAVGVRAGRLLTSGVGNVMIGQDTASSGNITGTYNVLIGGGGTAQNITSGQSNICLGFQAGRLNTTGSYNIATGQSSMSTLASGSDNICFGRSSLATSISSSNNIAIGQLSIGSANTSGGENVGIGTQTLSLLTTGTNNIGIGNQAGSSTTTGSNNIYLGQNVQGVSVSQSNSINLGNSSIELFRIPGMNIHASRSAGASPATPNFGIGTTTPNASAILDLTSSTLGALLPRVAFASLPTTLTAAAPGMLMVDSTNNKLMINTSATTTASWLSIADMNDIIQTGRIQKVTTAVNINLTASQCLKYKGGIEINNTNAAGVTATIPLVSGNFSDGDTLWIENRFNSAGNVTLNNADGFNFRNIGGTTSSTLTLTPDLYVQLRYDATSSLFLRIA